MKRALSLRGLLTTVPATQDPAMQRKVFKNGSRIGTDQRLRGAVYWRCGALAVKPTAIKPQCDVHSFEQKRQ